MVIIDRFETNYADAFNGIGERKEVKRAKGVMDLQSQ